MEEDRCWYYRGFLIMAEARRRPHHQGYEAVGAVIRQSPAPESIVAESPEGIIFLTEGSAVAYAREWCIELIDALDEQLTD